MIGISDKRMKIRMSSKSLENNKIKLADNIYFDEDSHASAKKLFLTSKRSLYKYCLKQLYLDKHGDYFLFYLDDIVAEIMIISIKHLKKNKISEDFDNVLFKIANSYLKDWFNRNRVKYTVRKNSGTQIERSFIKVNDKIKWETSDNFNLLKVLAKLDDETQSNLLINAISSIQGDSEIVCTFMFFVEKLSIVQMAQKTDFNEKQIMSFLAKGKEHVNYYLNQKVKTNERVTK